MAVKRRKAVQRVLINAAVIQFDVRRGLVEENLRRAEELIHSAAGNGAELIVLPELYYCGFDLRHAADYVQTSHDEAVAMPRRLAAQYGIYIVGGSYIEQRHGRLYNTSPAFGPDGEMLAGYRKIHLFPLHEPSESSVFAAGDELEMFELVKNGESVKIGMATCFDLRFPELFRNLALRGARIFTLPLNWAASRQQQLLCMCRSRACENVAYLLAANSVGHGCCGDSLIADPFGGLAVHAEDREGWFSSVIDTDFVQVHGWIDTVALRRPFVDEIDNNLL